MKLIHVTLGIAAAILMGTFFLMNQQYHKAKQMESSLQGLLGSAIYQIWSSYNDLEKYPPDEVNRERLNQINEKLISISAYSHLVDQKEGTNLLVPIAKDLRTITVYLNQQLQQQASISPNDQDVYRYMLQTIADINPQISDVYYIPGLLEGPKVTLKPNRTAVQKMVVFRYRLKEYAAQLV